jgi:hypothetical protein
MHSLIRIFLLLPPPALPPPSVFVEQVNASSHRQLLLGSWVRLSRDGDGGSGGGCSTGGGSFSFCICFDASGDTNLLAVWEDICSVADEVLAFHFKGVKNCKCGF